MKEDLCELFTQLAHKKGYSFSQLVQITSLNKTQINNVINHKGREVSLEKIIGAISELGYTINLSVEGLE